MGTSYLYSLSETLEIDAQFAGSMMKYANFASEDMTNCKARVVYVKGRRHICLYAKKIIEKGDEILFDYGYSEEKQTEIDWMNDFLRRYFFKS